MHAGGVEKVFERTFGWMRVGRRGMEEAHRDGRGASPRTGRPPGNARGRARDRARVPAERPDRAASERRARPRVRRRRSRGDARSDGARGVGERARRGSEGHRRRRRARDERERRGTCGGRRARVRARCARRRRHPAHLKPIRRGFFRYRRQQSGAFSTSNRRSERQKVRTACPQWAEIRVSRSGGRRRFACPYAIDVSTRVFSRASRRRLPGGLGAPDSARSRRRAPWVAARTGRSSPPRVRRSPGSRRGGTAAPRASTRTVCPSRPCSTARTRTSAACAASSRVGRTCGRR